MADEFKYDPEGEEGGAAKTRLPFGICKAHGIKIEDWWTPRHAWEALKNHGIVKEVSDEYKEYYAELKRKRAKETRKKKKERQARIDAQMRMAEHVPDANYHHQDGAIAGAKKGEPMSFEEADSGHVNPYFSKGYIGYSHNCQTCVAVYFARRQGYDVRALPNLNNRAIRDLSIRTSLAYVDEYGRHPNGIYKPAGQKIMSYLDNNVKEGAICTLEFDYVGKHSGHIVIAERLNGAVSLYDPQTNKKYTTEAEIRSFLHKTGRHSIMDLSRCRLDEEFCDKIMKRS